MKNPIDMFMDEVEQKWRSKAFKHQNRIDTSVIGGRTKIYMFYYLIGDYDFFVFRITYDGDFQTKHRFQLSCFLDGEKKELDYKTKNFASYCEKHQKEVSVFYEHLLNSFQETMNKNPHLRLYQLMNPNTFQNQIQENGIDYLFQTQKQERGHGIYEKLKRMYVICKTFSYNVKKR